MAKSRKQKLELFKECREKLYSLIIDWKETQGKDEERKYGMLKERLKKERMIIMLGRNEENTVQCLKRFDHLRLTPRQPQLVKMFQTLLLEDSF